jgi:hypothetical protein
MFSNNDKIKLEKYLITEERGKWEFEIIDKILRTSFEDMDKIRDAFGAVDLKKPLDKEKVMAEHFHNRNVLVHRNGKMKNGERMIITEENVRLLLADTKSFIVSIKNSIPQEV